MKFRPRCCRLCTPRAAKAGTWRALLNFRGGGGGCLVGGGMNNMNKEDPV